MADPVDPEKMYKIVLSKPVTYGGTVLKPRSEHIVKGKVVNELGDAVTSVEDA